MTTGVTGQTGGHSRTTGGLVVTVGPVFPVATGPRRIGHSLRALGRVTTLAITIAHIAGQVNKAVPRVRKSLIGGWQKSRVAIQTGFHRRGSTARMIINRLGPSHTRIGGLGRVADIAITQAIVVRAVKVNVIHFGRGGR